MREAGLGFVSIAFLVGALAAPLVFVGVPSSAQSGGSGTRLPANGQPASDVLASEDALGNPTFVGGLTNRGPTIGSVW